MEFLLIICLLTAPCAYSDGGSLSYSNALKPSKIIHRVRYEREAVENVFEREMDVELFLKYDGSRSEHVASAARALYDRTLTKYSSSQPAVTDTWQNELKMENLDIRRNRRDISIIQHFTERPISPGEDVSLQCAATGSKPPRFVWERDGTVISPNTDARYILGQMMSRTDVGVVAQLNITSAKVEDGGLYSCIAKDGDFSAFHTARLDVYGPPYIRALPPVKIKNGDVLELRCPYYGYPVSKLDWEYKGEVIQSAIIENARYKRFSSRKHPQRTKYRNVKRKRRKRQYRSSDNEVLVVTDVSKGDENDVYTCIVYSPTGEMAKRSFEIQVVEAPQLGDLRLGTGLKEGQIVQITCNIMTGDQPIYFSWLKDGKKIPSNLKITERSSDLFSVLIIKRVSVEHVGTYTCIATNHIGKDNKTEDLVIDVSPKWVEEPKNGSLLLGQRGTVNCNAVGYPTPQIHWMKRDDNIGIWRPILDLIGGGITNLMNGTLVIDIVSLSDEGMYSCNVDNGVGLGLNKTIWMTVNKPVHFESPSTNITTKVGMSVGLPCRPVGDHPLRIKWSFERSPVDFTTARLKKTETTTEDGAKSVLNINFVDVTDAGVYQCRASNPFGVATHIIYLSILEPPLPPIDVQTELVGSKTVKISWRDASTPHVEFYSIQYSSKDVASWAVALTLNVSRDETQDRQYLELTRLQPATEYKLRIASGNQINLSSYTEPVYFITQEEPPTSPPLDVRAQQTENPGELLVTWSPSSAYTHNGFLQGYQIQVHSGIPDEKPKFLKVLAREGKQEKIIGGLLKNTRYSVAVCAFNGAGLGPYSVPVFQTTREGAPEHAPASVECTALSSTSLRVSWLQIPTVGGSLIGYTLYYSVEDSPWYNVTTAHAEVYLQALSKYTNYTIRVAGFSNYGLGPFSYPIVCTTLQDVPGPPAAVKVLVSSPTSLIVTWKRPKMLNGEITYYTVYVKPALSTSGPEMYRVEPKPQTGLDSLDSYSLEVKHLKETSQYVVSVAAATLAGEGSPTAVVNRETTNRVVAGVTSLGGLVRVGVGNSLLLPCEGVGVPPPRIVWYHNQNIITHHPRFTRNHDDSLLLNNVDQSVSGNYTCLAKNLYGSDSVTYIVSVLPAPEPPVLRATPYKNSILVEWEQSRGFNNDTARPMDYNLTWREEDGVWHEAWPGERVTSRSTHRHMLTGLRCGRRYNLRMTATNSIGISQPSYVDVKTLGGVPTPPATPEWFWSNASHIYVQLNGWDENGCDVTKWDVEYRALGGRYWQKAENSIPRSSDWDQYESNPIYIQPNYYAISDLRPAQWYQIKVTAVNDAGLVTSVYDYSTRTENGEIIGPPVLEQFDLNMIVIICSSILLIICTGACIFILVVRRNQQHITEYRNSLTADCKSESGNLTATCQNDASNVKDSQAHCTRIYSTPIHVNNAKHELYEISPYAQFAIGFRTFGHVDNQGAPATRARAHTPVAPTTRFDTETSFQMRSESEESDCISRTTTLKSANRKTCRVPHHR